MKIYLESFMQTNIDLDVNTVDNTLYINTTVLGSLGPSATVFYMYPAACADMNMIN